MAWRTVVSVLAGVTVASMVAAAEQKIKKEDVPAAVLAAVTARYPKAELKQLEQEPSEDGKGIVYEVQVDDAGRITDVIVSPAGKILVEELTIARAELPEAVAKGLQASKYGKATVSKVERITEAGQAEPRYELLVESAGQNHELIFDHAGVLKEDEKKDKDEDAEDGARRGKK